MSAPTRGARSTAVRARVVAFSRDFAYATCDARVISAVINAGIAMTVATQEYEERLTPAYDACEADPTPEKKEAARAAEEAYDALF